MRLGFLSDLHITNNSNFIEQSVDIVAEACLQNQVDKLFMAGDTSNNVQMTFDFIKRMNAKGIDTYAVLGNHEYWSTTYEKTQKIDYDKYIHGKTVNINEDTVVIGIDGFFDYSFVLKANNYYTESIPKDIDRLTEVGKRSFDLSRMKIKNYEEVFLSMHNQLESQLKANQGKHIIVVMHYVPHENFVIYNSDKTWTACNSFMGSAEYHELFKAYGVNRVIFGHTHSTFNDIIDNVEYNCNPIGYKDYEFTEPFRERVNKMLNIITIK